LRYIDCFANLATVSADKSGCLRSLSYNSELGIKTGNGFGLWVELTLIESFFQAVAAVSAELLRIVLHRSFPLAFRAY